MENTIINNRYKLLQQLGKGSFGEVHKVYDIQKKTYIAAKIMTPTSSSNQYNHQVRALRILQKVKGIPKIYQSGHLGGYKYILMDLLGKSLQEMFYLQGKRISLDNIVNIAAQMVKRIWSMHKRHLLHRDLKPHQFLIGLQNTNLIYLVDFGLCKIFSTGDGIHLPYSENLKFVGTPYYASVNTHLGIMQSRRDDLESLCYIFSYLLNGSLPWIQPRNEESQSMVSVWKSKATPEQLFSEAPSQFIRIFQYVKSLSFDRKPDYKFIIGLLKQVKKSYRLSNQLQWNQNFLKLKRCNIKYHENSIQKVREMVENESDERVEDFLNEETKIDYQAVYNEMERTVISQQRPQFHWQTGTCLLDKFFI